MSLSFPYYPNLRIALFCLEYHGYLNTPGREYFGKRYIPSVNDASKLFTSILD